MVDVIGRPEYSVITGFELRIGHGQVTTINVAQDHRCLDVTTDGRTITLWVLLNFVDRGDFYQQKYVVFESEQDIPDRYVYSDSSFVATTRMLDGSARHIFEL